MSPQENLALKLLIGGLILITVAPIVVSYLVPQTCGGDIPCSEMRR